MKKMILTLALTLMASTNAFAGSYGLTCYNADKSIMVSKAYVYVGGKRYLFTGDATTQLPGVDVFDMLENVSNEPSDPQPIQGKVLISSRGIYDDVKQAGKKTLKVKHFKDECGNKGVETKFSDVVGIYDWNGGATLAKEVHLLCVERQIGGHCL